MTIRMKTRATVKQVCRVLKAVNSLGLQHEISKPGNFVLISIYDEGAKPQMLRPEQFAALSGVRRVDTAIVGNVCASK